MGYLGSLWRILDGEEGNQNIVNTAIQQHCFSMTCRILVLSDGTNSIRAFFLSTQHKPNYLFPEELVSFSYDFNCICS